jgi:hypothetical protein
MYDEFNDVGELLSREDEDQSELNREFGEAFDGPEDTDFSFAYQREDNSFANFGFDADKAAQMRKAELEEDISLYEEGFDFFDEFE